MKVKPLKDNILVKMIENEETSPNGIILTGAARGESNLAKVIETPEIFGEDQEILLRGETVMVTPHCGTEVKVDGETYRMVSYHDILAVFEK